MYRKLSFYLNREPAFRTIQMWIAEEYEDGNRSIATNIELEHSDKPIYREPVLNLQPEEAQQLMDELWNVGIRPSDVGTAGHLQAVQEHLKDMRLLANHLLENFLDG